MITKIGYDWIGGDSGSLGKDMLVMKMLMVLGSGYKVSCIDGLCSDVLDDFGVGW